MSNVTHYQTTTTAVDHTRCNFMYGPMGVWNTCDRTKGHPEPHHDSRTGVSWTNTFTARYTTILPIPQPRLRPIRGDAVGPD